jgi:hypothetical protein
VFAKSRELSGEVCGFRKLANRIVYLGSQALLTPQIQNRYRVFERVAVGFCWLGKSSDRRNFSGQLGFRGA